MQPIGERLEEARKSLGIALREASEATKIRTDYLQEMESGTFDFPLPLIYKRGFLKIYARYLKLDADKLVADFNTQFSGAARGRHEQDNLGRVDAPGTTATAGDSGSIYDAETLKRAQMYRLAVIISIVVVAVVVGYAAIQFVVSSSSSSSDHNATSASSTENTPSSVPAPKPPPPAPKPAPIQFTLSAQSAITSVIVTQDIDHAVLFSGAMKKGQKVPLTSQGTVEVKVSDTQFLYIEHDGQTQSFGDDTGKPLRGPQDFHWPHVAN